MAGAAQKHDDDGTCVASALSIHDTEGEDLPGGRCTVSASSGARRWRAPPHGFAPRASEVVGLCPCDWAVLRGRWTRVPSLPRQEGPCPLRSQAVTIPDRPHGEGTSASVCATPFLLDAEARKGRQSSSGCRLGAVWLAVPPKPDIQGTERTWRSRERRPGFGVAGLALGALGGGAVPRAPTLSGRLCPT